jgi:tyrosine-protein kinase Etk/Wzc
MGGSQVLLIDADLRRGALHERLDAERRPGLAELLQQPAALPKVLLSVTARRRRSRPTELAPEPDSFAQPQVIRATSVPNLFFLPRGGDLKNPGDLLLGPALDEILERLRKHFDFVVIDSCPVFAADDATSLAPKVDGTLVVVRNRYSRCGQVREALESLYQRQAKVLGIVFNRADAGARSYYHYTKAYSRYYGGPE